MVPFPASSAHDLASERTIFSRSLINAQVAQAKELAKIFGLALPPFAFWSKEDWHSQDASAEEIRDCMLGWDVTDFGSGDFFRIGRVLFTLRNGKAADSRYPKTYAEKLLFDPELQRAPAHLHLSKREDIICRAGGNIIVVLHNLQPSMEACDSKVQTRVNGIRHEFKAGEEIRLRPGDSITIPPGTVHQFWGEQGTGIPLGGRRFTLSSEISSVCDDNTDNVFLVEGGGRRFPEIVEDVEPDCYLCHEYPVNNQRMARGRRNSKSRARRSEESAWR